MYKKILAPLDGSELSECTLEHVRVIATGCQVPKVVLLNVIEPITPALEYTEALQIEAQAKAETYSDDYLTRVADSLKKGCIAAETAIVHGIPADEILDYATKNGVDLIIMSTHGRSGISRWTFGSVADRVLRLSTAPVLIIPPRGCRTSK